MKIKIYLALSSVGGAVCTLGGDGHYQMSALERFNRCECSVLDYLPMYLFRQIHGQFKCLWKPAFQCTAMHSTGKEGKHGGIRKCL